MAVVSLVMDWWEEECSKHREYIITNIQQMGECAGSEGAEPSNKQWLGIQSSNQEKTFDPLFVATILPSPNRDHQSNKPI
jgi:hypothetical protein